MTGSLERAIGETNRRRERQATYNKKHGITPLTIKKEIKDIAEQLRSEHQETVDEILKIEEESYLKSPKKFMKEKRSQMEAAVERLDFETAAIIRDQIAVLEESGKEPKKK
jgi:excinuclease ABC subunit B